MSKPGIHQYSIWLAGFTFEEGSVTWVAFPHTCLKGEEMDQSDLALRLVIKKLRRSKRFWHQVRCQARSFHPLPWGRQDKVTLHPSGSQHEPMNSRYFYEKQGPHLFFFPNPWTLWEGLWAPCSDLLARGIIPTYVPTQAHTCSLPWNMPILPWDQGNTKMVAGSWVTMKVWASKLGLLLSLWTLEEKEEELQQREYLVVPGSA